MKNYRTSEQFAEICESAINGNWNQAFREGFEAGFYAQDLIKHYEEESNGIEFEDLVYLAEGIQKLR